MAPSPAEDLSQTLGMHLQLRDERRKVGFRDVSGIFEAISKTLSLTSIRFILSKSFLIQALRIFSFAPNREFFKYLRSNKNASFFIMLCTLNQLQTGPQGKENWNNFCHFTGKARKLSFLQRTYSFNLSSLMFNIISSTELVRGNRGKILLVAGLDHWHEAFLLRRYR